MPWVETVSWGHGTGTSLGDPIEIGAYRKAEKKSQADAMPCKNCLTSCNCSLCRWCPWCPGVSTKQLDKQFDKLKRFTKVGRFWKAWAGGDHILQVKHRALRRCDRCARNWLCQLETRCSFQEALVSPDSWSASWCPCHFLSAKSIKSQVASLKDLWRGVFGCYVVATVYHSVFAWQFAASLVSLVSPLSFGSLSPSLVKSVAGNVLVLKCVEMCWTVSCLFHVKARSLRRLVNRPTFFGHDQKNSGNFRSGVIESAKSARCSFYFFLSPLCFLWFSYWWHMSSFLRFIACDTISMLPSPSQTHQKTDWYENIWKL